MLADDWLVCSSQRARPRSRVSVRELVAAVSAAHVSNIKLFFDDFCAHDIWQWKLFAAEIKFSSYLTHFGSVSV